MRRKPRRLQHLADSRFAPRAKFNINTKDDLDAFLDFSLLTPELRRQHRIADDDKQLPRGTVYFTTPTHQGDISSVIVWKPCFSMVKSPGRPEELEDVLQRRNINGGSIYKGHALVLLLPADEAAAIDAEQSVLEHTVAILFDETDNDSARQALQLYDAAIAQDETYSPYLLTPSRRIISPESLRTALNKLITDDAPAMAGPHSSPKRARGPTLTRDVSSGAAAAAVVGTFARHSQNSDESGASQRTHSLK